MEDPKFPCPRHGFSNISNNASETSKAWWKRLFEIMVNEVCVPPHLCVEVLKDIFPNKILESIYTILGITQKPLKQVVSDRNIQELASHFLKIDYVAEFNKNRLAEKLNDLNMEQSKETTFSNVLHKRDLKIKAYLKFLHKKDKKEIIVIDKNLKLAIKAKMITEKIAHDFVKWLKKFEKSVQNDIIEIFKLFNITFSFPQNEDDSDSSSDSSPHVASKIKLKVKNTKRKNIENALEQNNSTTIFEFHQILKMFEIGFHNEATTSTAVEIKELPIYSQKKIFQLAEKEATLHKRVKEKELMHYFQTLIQDRSVNFSKSNFVKELESMEVTFKNITHLRSVKAYCKWLIDHPERERPEFLEMENMFTDAALIKNSEESIAVIDSDNILF